MTAVLFVSIRRFATLETSLYPSNGFFEGKVDLVFNNQTNDRLRIHNERLTVKLDIVDSTIVLFKSQIRF